MILKVVLSLVFLFAFGLSDEAYHDDAAPGCGVLNYEKVESFPERIEVNRLTLSILGQIQHGATSKVYHALYYDDQGRKQCVAVKVVDMGRIERHLQNQVTNEAQLLSELNERRTERIPLLYALEHHPTKQTMSMVLELAHHDLFDEITPKMGRGRYGWVRRTVRDILNAMNPVHENEIVHGDIKPENMAYFLTPEGQLVLKVIDFGGAMRTSQLGEACSEIVTGTVMYMSPEQVTWCAAHGDEAFLERRKELPLTKKADVWSIGIILYQMLFGRNPYSWVMQKYEDLSEPERTEKADQELREVIFGGERPIQFGEYEDGAMLEMLKKCLDRNPERRPEVPELLAELEKLGELSEKLKKLEEDMEKELKEKEEMVKKMKEEKEKMRGEEEKMRAEEEKMRAEEEKMRAEEEKMRAEEERR